MSVKDSAECGLELVLGQLGTPQRLPALFVGFGPKPDCKQIYLILMMRVYNTRGTAVSGLCRLGRACLYRIKEARMTAGAHAQLRCWVAVYACDTDNELLNL